MYSEYLISQERIKKNKTGYVLWKQYMIILMLNILIFMGSCSQPTLKPVQQHPSQVQVVNTRKYNSVISDLKKSIPEMMETVGIPGLSLAIFNPSGIVWLGHFGIQSTKTARPISDSTVFVAASFSKVVFSYLVLKMADQGKINLDTPLIQYAPRSYIEKEFKKIQDKQFKNITPRMVLTHSTGFPDLRLIGRSVKINYPPGTRFSYSGEVFYLLQKIVEYIDKKSVNVMMKEYVFEPLGMKSSSYVVEDRFKNRMAKGHHHWLHFIFNRKFQSNKTARADRSLLTTTEDYARFLKAFMQGSGLDKATYHDMTIPQINANSRHIFWGLGIGMDILNSDTIYWHDGEAVIFKNYFAFKKNGIGFVYFSNSSKGLSIGEALSEKILTGHNTSFRWLQAKQFDAPVKQLMETYESLGLKQSLSLYYQLSKEKPARIQEPVLNNFGYYLLQNKQYDDAIRIFKLNVEKYPQSANVYDSLAEAYLKKGNKDLAFHNYNKSLYLNPNNINAKNMIKKLSDNS